MYAQCALWRNETATGLGGSKDRARLSLGKLWVLPCGVENNNLIGTDRLGLANSTATSTGCPVRKRLWKVWFESKFWRAVRSLRTGRFSSLLTNTPLYWATPQSTALAPLLQNLKLGSTPWKQFFFQLWQILSCSRFKGFKGSKWWGKGGSFQNRGLHGN